MKKGMSILTMIAAFVLFTSTKCEKDYTCQCQGGISGTPAPITIQASNTKSAQKECDKHNSPAGSPDGFHDCKIK